MKSLWNLAFQRFRERIKDVLGKGKGRSMKERKKKKTVCLGKAYLCFSRLEIEKSWKVHLFIQQLIIEYLLCVLDSEGTVVNKIDKNTWHPSMRWQILCKILHKIKICIIVKNYMKKNWMGDFIGRVNFESKPELVIWMCEWKASSSASHLCQGPEIEVSQKQEGNLIG